MLPKGSVFLPAPPDSVSPEFVDDMLQWQWGKSVRATERGAQAYRESYKFAPSMFNVMAQVLELDSITFEQTPAPTVSTALPPTIILAASSSKTAARRSRIRSPRSLVNNFRIIQKLRKLSRNARFSGVLV